MRRFRWACVVPPEAEYTTHITYTREVARLHDAWNYLLDVGKAMAETHGVKPEELILSQSPTRLIFHATGSHKVYSAHSHPDGH